MIVIWKTSANLWQFFRVTGSATLADSESFKCMPYDGNTKNVEITVPLNY